mmetsp:Transcript_36815/g.95319  ORF Transcript_36815/g.95319 Transcript_36815/m.95319 type:complete len:80 (+) Transcript_36815:2076-2315(+)
MPIMDGYACTAEIRKRDWVYASLPIFAATAGGLVEAVQSCGMDGMMHKPFTKKNFLKVLQALPPPGTIEGRPEGFRTFN